MSSRIENPPAMTAMRRFPLDEEIASADLSRRVEDGIRAVEELIRARTEAGQSTDEFQRIIRTQMMIRRRVANRSFTTSHGNNLLNALEYATRLQLGEEIEEEFERPDQASSDIYQAMAHYLRVQREVQRNVTAEADSRRARLRAQKLAQHRAAAIDQLLISVPIDGNQTELEPCPICGDEYGATTEDAAHEACMLPDCRHVFGRECIGTWLKKQKNTCPLCRAEVEVKIVVPKAAE
ncbi:Ubiquitin-protein ligase [Ciborinia camelliae]|nr:Ubiquitin-protein ligase [Ciborinia camelliae]